MPSLSTLISKKKYNWKERLIHPLANSYNCSNCNFLYLDDISTSEYKDLYCSKECEMAYIPAINTYGKPYGAYPYGVTNGSTAMQQQQNILMNQIGGLQTQGQTSAGLLGPAQLSNLSSTATTTSPVVMANGYITFTTSVTSCVKQEMPFTKDIVNKLKAVEPRLVKKRVPDYIAPIMAWRAWCIYEGKLHAIGASAIWEPKRPMEAVCIKVGLNNEHVAPESQCTCGIWSFKELDSLLEAVKTYTTIKVIGQVSLWGKIIETENGYRAQYAYPKELWLSDMNDEEIGLIYNVPIRTISLDMSVNSEVK